MREMGSAIDRDSPILILQELAPELQAQISLDTWGPVVRTAMRTNKLGHHKLIRLLMAALRRAACEVSEVEQQKLCMTCLAALPDMCFMEGMEDAESSFSDACSPSTMYQVVINPLLSADTELLVARHDQIIQVFSRLVAAGDHWASTTQVVQLAAAAMQADLHAGTPHPTAGGVISVRTLCSLVTALLDAALQQTKPDCGARGTFLQSSLDLLQPVVLAAFSASSAAHEEIAWPVLLPALIAVAEQLDQTCRGQFADALWSACRGAVQRKGQRKHAALAALVKSADFLMPSGNSVGPDIRSDPALMAILRQLLVDEDAFTRKRGMYLLEEATKMAPALAQPAWQALLQLMALLEDFALHLIKGPWEALLHKAQAAAPHASSPQAHSRRAADGLVADAAWLAVVWRRALTHPSPSVQMFALESLFKQEKADPHVLLPMSCVLDCVVPAFSRGLAAGEVDESAGRAYLRKYTATLPRPAARSFLLALLRLDATPPAAKLAQPVILHTAMAAAQSLASAASDQLDEEWCEEVLLELSFTASQAVQHTSSPPVLSDILSIARVVCPPSRVALLNIGALLAELPLDSLQPEGDLLPAVQGWLSSEGGARPDQSAQLVDLFHAYFGSGQLPNKESAAGNADRWARLVLVLSDSIAHDTMSNIFGQLQEKVVWLADRPYLAEGLPFRVLTLLRALLQVVPTQPALPLYRHLQQCTHLTAPYLGSYTLRCAEVFDGTSQPTAALPASQTQVVVPVSAAAQSVLPAHLQSQVSLAHLALQTTLLTLSCSASSSASGQHNRSEVDCLTGSITRLLHTISCRWQGAAGRPHPRTSALAAQLHVEELSAVASCCKVLCAMSKMGRVLSPTHIPGEELLQCLLDGQLSTYAPQTSDLKSQSQRASWQTIQSVLDLLSHPKASPLPPKLLSDVLVAAAADAQTIPIDALVALLGSLRTALEAAARWPEVARLAATSPHFPAMDASLSAADVNLADEQHTHNLIHVVAVTAKACWLAVSEEDKLRPAHCQALLHTFLSTSFFVADMPAHLRSALHGEEGPLHWLVHQVLRAGQRSPRLLALAALHLAPLFLACPSVALYYQEHIKQLLLCNVDHASSQGSAFDTSALQRLLPAAADQAASSHACPRVAAVCLVHQLACLPPAQPGHGPCQQQRAAADEIGQNLYSSLLEEPVLQVASYQINSAVHRAKLRIWQALAVLSAFIPREGVQAAVAQLWPILQGKDVSSVRQYIESILVNLMLQDPVKHMQQHVLPSLRTYHARHHDGITSAILVGAQVVRHASPASQEELWEGFVAAAWPWTMWHHHAIRTFAQLVLHQLLEEAPEAGPRAPHHLPSVWSACLTFFRANPDMQRLERSLGPGLRTYNPPQAITPAGVFHSGAHLAGSSEERVGLEGAPPTLLDSVTSFLNSQRAALRLQASSQLASCTTTGTSDEIMMHSNADFQRKMVPLDHLLGGLDLAADEDGTARTSGSPSGSRAQGLIVVASLIDKVPNLAGLTRTCEVFRAAAMVVSDKRVTKDALFSSISVTAEQWIPLLEVPEADLCNWMLRKKAEGYTLIGLEQTAESTPLPHFAFPDKSVLLLGREREGIPLQLLQLLAHTVEIPQLGMIRSLNVHVSGAIAMYEYSRQRFMQKEGMPAIAI